ncbi:MAG TPA: DNA mismatch repair protein MutS [Aliiroseovarius sp.]|nr:DNA mismatch repair protein MutS [Aliiroseovarius sp.]
MRKPRNLSPEERALWERVAGQTERLGPVQRGALPQSVLPKPVSKPPKKPPIAPFQIGAKATKTAPAPGAGRAAPISMDAKAYRKMKSGKLAPEARLDLHGHTLDQAHPRLVGFIETSAARKLRLVLVITGKGRVGSDTNPIPSRPGVLRRQVPHWLRSMPAVLEITEASRNHGGEGALYVYLRKRRG